MPNRWTGTVGRGLVTTATSRVTTAAVTSFSGGGVTLLDDVNIGNTGVDPDHGVAILIISSTVEPDPITGFTQTIDTGTLGASQSLYVYEKTPDTAATVDVTFPSSAVGVLLSIFTTTSSTVAARDSANLGAQTSFTEDFDPTSPPSTILVCTFQTGASLLTITPGGTDLGPGVPDAQWDFVNGGGSTGILALYQYLTDPPSTTWAENGTQTIYGWVMLELA